MSKKSTTVTAKQPPIPGAKALSYGGNRVWKIGSACVFKAHMAIDADGAPDAYGPNNSGTDWNRNAGKVGSKYGYVEDSNSNPIVQDPSLGTATPGMYVSKTAWVNPYAKVPPGAPRGLTRDQIVQRYVDSNKIPYIAFRKDMLNAGLGGKGDIALVVRASTGTHAYAVIADIKKDNIGEGSIKLCDLMGAGTNPRAGNSVNNETYVYCVFKRSKIPNWFPETDASIAKTASDPLAIQAIALINQTGLLSFSTVFGTFLQSLVTMPTPPAPGFAGSGTTTYVVQGPSGTTPQTQLKQPYYFLGAEKAFATEVVKRLN